MNKVLRVYKGQDNKIYLDDVLNETDEPNFVMVWEKSELLFNDLLAYQEQGYTIIFAI